MILELDSPWKDTLDDYLEELLRSFCPETHALVDWSYPVENLETELPKLIRDGELGRTIADRLYRVRERGTAEPLYLLIHAEVQSQRDEELAHRMFVYHYRIKDAYGRAPIGLAILGDTSESWRPDHYEWIRGRTRLRYEFESLKLWDWRHRIEELEAMPGFIGSAVLAHLQSQLTRNDPTGRMEWKWRLMRRLYDKGYGPEEIRRAFRIIDWFLNLPPELERQLTLRAVEFEKEHIVPYVWSVERMAKEDGRRENITLALKAKFGDAGVRYVETELATADSLLLDRVITTFFLFNTLDELRASIARP
ncbi:RpnC/YadD family protein [Zavarzinella formosa]|uniref:hypothetical protein n=1 Tax=Zavarzinella formosa TaxID=360055 RepID=UPI0002D319F3|nr:hypothetical protein [Zavarzinella formosa]